MWLINKMLSKHNELYIFLKSAKRTYGKTLGGFVLSLDARLVSLKYRDPPVIPSCNNYHIWRFCSLLHKAAEARRHYLNAQFQQLQ